VLNIAYLEMGDRSAPAVILVHGWPDAARGWWEIAEALDKSGWRVIVPDNRGTGTTTFLSSITLRDGSAVALVQDTLDLADSLGLQRFAVVGHDWGARVAYSLAALAPERINATAAFAREQWNTWSPAGWFDDHEFAATAAAFRNPDWTAITLNAYRGRFLTDEPRDRRYDRLRRQLGAVERLDVPTLMIQGGSDFCDEPRASEGLDGYFDTYARVVLDGVGHFPHREAPAETSRLVLDHLQAHKS
jgi:pimeloyl-ACP methyl ester carboxylesterase